MIIKKLWKISDRNFSNVMGDEKIKATSVD